MKALLILPPDSVDALQVERAQKALQYRFSFALEFGFCSPESHLESHKASLSHLSLLCYEKDELHSYAVVGVLMGEKGQQVHPKRIDHRQSRVYYADAYGVFRYPSPTIDTTEYPHLNTHIFNSITAENGNEKVTFFPYGFTYRNTNLGPINEFGHRIEGSLAKYQAREKNEKIVAIFGGSCAWSIFCLQHETFSQRLEDKLNHYAKSIGSSDRFKVLNFAQPVGVLLNEMITYLLFCAPLNPNIVITHSGANDFIFGQKSDSYLLNQHHLTYQWNLESWAQILWQQNLGNSQNEGAPIPDYFSDSLPVTNYPRSIVKAYYNRMIQFKRLVESNGALFISGLQPLIQSKGKMSAEEEKLLSAIPQTNHMNNLPFIYETFLKKYQAEPYQHFVNFHEIFSQYDEKSTLFGDHFHTLPPGDEILAHVYFEKISNQLWNWSFDRRDLKTQEEYETSL